MTVPRRRTALTAAAVIVALFPARALAQEPAAAPVGGAVSGFGAWDWVDLAARLGVVLVVIWVAVMAMRWYVRRMSGVGGGSGSRQLQVMETRTLGPNRSLHLVRLGRRAVLLGVTQERINAVMEIDDPDEVRELVDTAEQVHSGGALQSIVGGLGSAFSLRRRRRAAPSAAVPDAYVLSAMPPATPAPPAPRPASRGAPPERAAPRGVAAPAGAADAAREAQMAQLQEAIARAREGVLR